MICLNPPEFLWRPTTHSPGPNRSYGTTDLRPVVIRKDFFEISFATPRYLTDPTIAESSAVAFAVRIAVALRHEQPQGSNQLMRTSGTPEYLDLVAGLAFQGQHKLCAGNGHLR